MANTFNTGVYPQEWETKLQQRLNRPVTWKEFCKVVITDTHTLNMPYMSTTPSVQDGTRGTANSFQDFALTNDTLAITTYKTVPMYIDYADLAQTPLASQMELATRQASLLNERVETAVLADHASWTDFDNASIGGAAGNITVSASNIDDIIRGVRREIREANGQELADTFGIGFVWRVADFEILEAFTQNFGFSEADKALKNGTESGLYYLGAYHYFSNNHAAGHVLAGVRKQIWVGVLRSTYGKLYVVQNPAGASGGVLSGVGLDARIDYGIKLPNVGSTVTFDVLVA